MPLFLVGGQMRALILTLALCLSTAFAWDYIEQIDRFTDVNTSGIIVLERNNENAGFAVRCASTTIGIDVVVAAGTKLESATFVNFALRVDNRPTVFGLLGVVGASGTSIRLDIAEDVAEGLLSGAERLSIRINDTVDAVHDLDFDIRGFDEAFKRISSCYTPER